MRLRELGAFDPDSVVDADLHCEYSHSILRHSVAKLYVSDPGRKVIEREGFVAMLRWAWSSCGRDIRCLCAPVLL